MLNVVILIVIFLIGAKSIYTIVKKRPRTLALHIVIDAAFYGALIGTIIINNFDLIPLTAANQAVVGTVMVVSLPFKIWSFFKTRD